MDSDIASALTSPHRTVFACSDTWVQLEGYRFSTILTIVSLSSRGKSGSAAAPEMPRGRKTLFTRFFFLTTLVYKYLLHTILVYIGAPSNEASYE